MKRTLSVMLASAGLLVVAARPIVAHHSFAAEFDANSPVKLQGTVSRVEWINPHAWIHIDVKDPSGKVESWMAEAGTPNTLFRRGFTKESLLPGTEIVVDGYRAKDGSHKMNGRNVKLPDGRTLFLGSSGTGAPKDGADSKDK